jgi:hypothetical protein
MPRLFEGNVDTQPNDDHSTDVFCTRERAFERIASILTRKAWARSYHRYAFPAFVKRT